MHRVLVDYLQNNAMMRQFSPMCLKVVLAETPTGVSEEENQVSYLIGNRPCSSGRIPILFSLNQVTMARAVVET